jgi:hypothetical protein
MVSSCLGCATGEPPDAKVFEETVHGAEPDASTSIVVPPSPSPSSPSTPSDASADAACSANVDQDLAHCGGCGKACPPRTTTCTKGVCRGELRVRAFIDGTSRILLHGSTLKWHHIEASAPGLWEKHNDPTYLDNLPWTPTWPSSGDAKSCNCMSSSSNAVPPLPAKAQTVTLTPIAVRDEAKIREQPSATNDFTATIELHDGNTGAAWYEVVLAYDTR